jgi:hypothetical protein
VIIGATDVVQRGPCVYLRPEGFVKCKSAQMWKINFVPLLGVWV